MDEAPVSSTTAEALGAPSGQAAPLQQIRQREAEFCHRVLAAKREADEIVADARRQAAAIIEGAIEESSSAARRRVSSHAEKARAQAQALLAEADVQAASLTDSLAGRIDEAAEYVVESVMPG